MFTRNRRSTGRRLAATLLLGAALAVAQESAHRHAHAQDAAEGAPDLVLVEGSTLELLAPEDDPRSPPDQGGANPAAPSPGDPGASDPAVVDPAAVNPTAADPLAADPTVVDPTAAEPAAPDAPASVSIYAQRVRTADAYGYAKTQFRRGDDLHVYVTIVNATRWSARPYLTIDNYRLGCFSILPGGCNQTLYANYVGIGTGTSTFRLATQVAAEASSGGRRITACLDDDPGSCASTEVSIAGGGGGTPPYPPPGSPPAAPTDLQATGVSASEIRLTWRDQSNNESGFRVLGHGVNATVGANTTSFTVTGLGPDSHICYQVVAYNGYGESAGSNWSCGTTHRRAVECSAPDNAIVLYEHLLAGRCWWFTSDHNDFNAIGANDTVSSIQFRGSFAAGWEAELYEHSDFVGGSTVFRGDNWELGNTAVGNDRASSIRIRRANQCQGRSLAIGEAVTGYIGEGEVHRFCFTGNAGRWVSVRAVRTSGGLDPVVRLELPDGRAVENDDAFGYGTDAMLVSDLPRTGAYPLQLRGYSGSYGAYRLHVGLNRKATVADANSDCRVGEGDRWLIENFYGEPSYNDETYHADVNLDGIVNTFDMAIVLDHWGQTCR